MEGITRYNQINKVEPMDRALRELGAQTWFSGLRREQAGSRGKLPVLAIQRGRFKFLPVIDWSNKDVFYYFKEFDLPITRCGSWVTSRWAMSTPPPSGSRA